MHVIAKSKLIGFAQSLPRSERAKAEAVLRAWHAEASDASWSNFAEVRASFNTADWVGDGKVVFDVGGNKYRIVGLIGFKTKRVFLLFVGTHKQYDAVDVSAL